MPAPQLVELLDRENLLIYTASSENLDYFDTVEEACKLNVDLTGLMFPTFADEIQTVRDKNFSNGKFNGAFFRNTNFENCNFDGATFINVEEPPIGWDSGITVFADWSYVSEMTLYFDNCSFRNANFAGCFIGYYDELINFHPLTFRNKCDFTNANFNNVVLFGQSIEYININLFDNCIFNNVNFSPIKLSERTLTRGKPVYFSDCKLINCNFSETDFNNFIKLSDTTYTKLLQFFKCDFNRTNFTNIKLLTNTNPFNNDCILNKCNFFNSEIKTDFSSKNISFNNAIFDDANLETSSFNNIQEMSGCSFNNTILSNCDFSYVNLSNSNFSKCIFDKTIFYKTILINGSITESVLSDLNSYTYFNLSATDLSKSTLNNLNLTTVILNDADLTNALMSGVFYSTINSEAESNALYELAKAEAITATDKILLENEYLKVRDDIQAESNAEITYYQSKENYDTYFGETSATINTGNGMKSVVEVLAVARSQAWDTYSKVNGITSPVYKLQTYIGFTNSRDQHEDQISRTKTFWETNDVKGKIIERERLKGINETDWQNWKNLEDALDTILKPYKSLVKKLADDNEKVLYWQQEVIKANETASDRIYANLEGVNLTNVDLGNSDLSYVNLKNTNLTNTKMQNVTFDHAILYDANLSQKALGGCSFVGAFLSGATFFDYSESNISFSGADLYQASFTNSNIQNNNFSRAILKGASFNNVVLSGANGPDFSYADLSDTEMPRLNFTYNTNFTGTILSGANLSESDFTYTSMVSANLSETNLSNANIENSYFDKCLMIGADLSESKMDYTKFDGSNLSNSYMYKVNADYCSFKDCIISASDLRKSSFDKTDFRESRMMESDIRDCYFHTNNFTDANLSRVKAFKSDFYYPVLTRTKLTFLENQKLNLMRTS